MSEENRDNLNFENRNHEESDTPQDVCEPLSITEEAPPMPIKRTVSLTTFITTTIALILVAVMLTYTVCNSVYKKELGQAKLSQIELGNYQNLSPFEILGLLLKSESYYDLDTDALINAAMKAYVKATGDPYAVYYTAEEYLALQESSSGSSVGIGVTFIWIDEVIEGTTQKVFRIVGVSPDSPAEEAGLVVGDSIAYVGSGADRVSVDSLGYYEAFDQLTGMAGTDSVFTVCHADGALEEYAVERKPVESLTVFPSICTTDSKVGTVLITRFSNKTPRQFIRAVQQLQDAGCEYFVFDLRGNPGGELDSIVAVMSTFLQVGDVVIHLEAKGGERETICVTEPNPDQEKDDYTIFADEIGMFSDLKIAVLCDEETGSAAELFVANVRDHELGVIVGTKTYGKGSVQSRYSLALYGLPGAVKLTTSMYFPPSGEGYDGVGISPHMEVELNEALKDVNKHAYDDAIDNQLQAAISAMQSK